MRAKPLFLSLLILLLGACGQNGDDAAGRGKQVYLTECIACHNPDPARDGVLGPAIKGTIHAGFILTAVFYLLFETVMRG